MAVIEGLEVMGNSIWRPPSLNPVTLSALHPQNNTTRPNDWKIPVHPAMLTTRAAENTIWFASCNVCYPEHQNCRSMIVAPDGQVHAQTELKREELLIADIDMAQATRAMFEFNLEACTPLLFADTVSPDEITG